MADLKDISSRLERIESILGRIPSFADPPPDPFSVFSGWRARLPFNLPIHGDPPPLDFSRFTRAQLSVAKEMINVERSRLDAMEKLIDGQMKTAGK